jgi:TPP-dependent pyruvate/acetoin dehydrogenase alpha subunit
VSAQVTETAHGSLGLAVDDLLGMHRTMVTARLIDEAALRQNRMGRAPFVVPVSGHEGCHVGARTSGSPITATSAWSWLRG